MAQEASEALDEVSSAHLATRPLTVTVVAVALAVAFAVPHLALSSVAATFNDLYRDMGGEISRVSALVLQVASAAWFPVAILLLDAAIFVVMYRLARRYWIGLMFTPPLFYLALSSVLGWLMYMPTSQITTLVQ